MRAMLIDNRTNPNSMPIHRSVLRAVLFLVLPSWILAVGVFQYSLVGYVLIGAIWVIGVSIANANLSNFAPSTVYEFSESGLVVHGKRGTFVPWDDVRSVVLRSGPFYPLDTVQLVTTCGVVSISPMVSASAVENCVRQFAPQSLRVERKTNAGSTIRMLAITLLIAMVW